MSAASGQFILRQVAGREIPFDEEGFFHEHDDWSEAACLELAAECGMELTPVHWQVMHAFRDYYLTNGRAPLNRELKAATGMSVLDMERLFPEGLKNGARRLAGLPNPKTCS